MNPAAGFLGMDWQTWLGVAIGSVVTVLVALLIYRLQKTPRTLDYAIISSQDLTPEESPHLRARMEITWREEPVGGAGYGVGRILQEPRITTYMIRNTGKRAIDADDFKSPIKIKATDGKIIHAVVTEVSHEGVHELGSIPLNSDTEGVFTPALMNPKDWIIVHVITDGCSKPPKFTSWIREESRSMQSRQEIIVPIGELLRVLWASKSTFEKMKFLGVVLSYILLIVAFGVIVRVLHHYFPQYIN